MKREITVGIWSAAIRVAAILFAFACAGNAWGTSRSGLLGATYPVARNMTTGGSYATLQAAFDAAESGDTVQLLNDITDASLGGKGVVISGSRTITLDLAGFGVTCTDGSGANNRLMKIAGTTTLNVTNSSDSLSVMDVLGGNAPVPTSASTMLPYGVFRAEVGTTLNIDGGEGKNIKLVNGRAWGLNIKVVGATAVLNNVVVESQYGGGIEVTEDELGDNSVPGSATLTGCEFSQAGYFNHCSTTMFVAGGSRLVVNGGSYTSKDYALYVFSSGGFVTVNGGTFSGDREGVAIKAEIDTNTYPGYEGGLEIRGGAFSGGYGITSPAFMSVYGGIFSVNPSACLAAQCAVAENRDIETKEAYPWAVGKVSVGTVVQQGGATDTSATYAVTVDVVNEQNEPVGTIATPATIAVSVGASDAADTTLEKFDMGEVLAIALASVGGDCESVAAVELKVSPTVVSSGAGTITYEVNPEAVVTVEKPGAAATTKSVGLSNDALADGATFAFRLDVADIVGAEGETVKVVHDGGGQHADETFYLSAVRSPGGGLAVSMVASLFSRWTVSAWCLAADTVAVILDDQDSVLAEFPSVAAAVSDVTVDGWTVMLVRDATETITEFKRKGSVHKKTLRLNGHTIFGRVNVNWAGILDLDSGAVTNMSGEAVTVQSSGTLKMSGGALYGSTYGINMNDANGNIEISGGVIHGENYAVFFKTSAVADGKVRISGGVFTNGSSSSENAMGNWDEKFNASATQAMLKAPHHWSFSDSVVARDENGFVYATLLGAVTSSSAGTNITLLADIDEGDIEFRSVRRTLDLNGHTIFGKVVLNYAGILEMSDGCITNAAGPAVVMASSGILRMHGGKVFGSTYGIDASSAVGASLEISGGQIHGGVGALSSVRADSAVAVSGGFFSSAVAGSSIVPGKTNVRVVSGEPEPWKVDVATASVGGVAYDSVAAAVGAAQSGDTVRLLAPLALTAAVVIDKDLTIDLNGNTISSTTLGNVVKVDKAKLTLAGTGTIDTSAAPTSAGYYTIQVVGATTDPNGYPYGLVVPAGVTIRSNGYAVQVANNSGHAYGVQLDLNGTIVAAYGVTVNGTVADTEGSVPVVNMGGTMTGILYGAGYAKYNVNADITFSECAVEIRAGELSITGGTYTSTATEFKCQANGSGTSIEGAAVAISQHSTVKPIAVSITGGTFNGLYGLYEENVQNSSTASDITIGISGGTFNGTAESVKVLDAGTKADVAVSGGTFSSPVLAANCADGFIPEATTVNDVTTYGVIPGYKVTFVNYDGTTELFSTNVAVGGTAAYEGETPTKAATAQYTFTWSGWTYNDAAYGTADALAAVSDAAQTYTATYSSMVNDYTATVTIPANTAITVITNGVAISPDMGTDNQFTVPYGTELTVEYAASGAYVASGAQSQVVTVNGAQVIQAPADYAVNSAVAQAYVSDAATYFTSLLAAVNAADGGSTVTLLADDTSLAGGAEMEIAKSLTITGAVAANGEPLYTIYGKNTATGTNDIFINGSGTVTLSNVKIAQFGNNANTDMGHAPVYVSSHFTGTVNMVNVYVSEFNRGGVFLYGGNFNVTGCYIDCANSRSGAFTKGVEIKGTATGTIKDTVIVNMERSSTDYTSAGIEIYGSGSVVVDGCSIFSDVDQHQSVKATYGIVIDKVGAHDPSGGSLLVTNSWIGVSNGALSVSEDYSVVVDGEETCFSSYIATWSASSSITINEGEFSEDVYADAGTIVITGGAFDNFAPDTDTGTISISGGTFDAEVPEEYCAEGFVPATFDEETGLYTVIPGYKVTFVNYDGATVLFETNVAVGDTAVYEGETPTKPADASGVYTFSGWSPDIAAVTDAAQTYTAQYSSVAPVATFGGAYYATVQEAVDAVAAGGAEYATVNLISDVTLPSGLVVSGKKVDFEASEPVVVSGQLRATDGASVTIGTNVTFTSAAHPTLFATGCKSVKPLVAGAKTTVEIYGSVLNTNPEYDQTFAVSGNGSDDDGVDVTVYASGVVSNANGIAIYQPQPGTLSVYGKVVGASAITIKDGTLNVYEGAVVAATGDYVGHAANGNGASPSGDAIQVPYYPASAGYGTPAVTVSGGTIEVADEGASGIQAYDNNGVAAPEDSASNVNVQGGEFNRPVALEYCANGYHPVLDSATGKYGVAEGAAVAQVGETYYVTLPAAIAAAASGDTVKLLADVQLSERLFVNAGATPAYAGSNNRYATTSDSRSVTIDLNGCSITNSSNIALAGGSLAIVGTGTIATTDSGLAPVEVRGTGSLASKRTLAIGPNVTLASTSGAYGLNVFGSNDSQKNVIDVTVDGTVNGTLFVLGNLTNPANEINIVVNGTVAAPAGEGDSVNVGIALNGNASVTVNEGASVSGDSGIEVRAGSLAVNGGTITATAAEYSYKSNNSGSTTKGAAISVAQHATVLPTAVTLNGGTLEGVEKVYVKEVNAGMPGVTVQATAAYTATAEIPEDSKWVETGTAGVYVLAQKEYVVRAIDGNGELAGKYESLQEAFDNAPAGCTVQPMQDISLARTVKVSGGASVKLDLAGRRVSVGEWANVPGEDSLFCVKYGGSLAVTNSGDATTGTIDATGNAAKVWAAVKMTEAGEVRTGNAVASLTVDGGTLVGYYYGIVGNGSRHGTEITVNGGTVEGTCPGDNLAIFHPQSGTLTLNGGTLRGATGVEMRAGSLVVPADSTVVVVADGAYKATPSGSGSTVVGAAVALSQHTTDRGLSASVSGGTFRATGANGKAFVEVDLQNEVVDGIAATLSGGTFYGEVETENVATLIPAESEAQFTDAEAEGVPEGYALKETSKGSGLYAIEKTYVVVYANYDGTALQTTTNFVNEATPAYAGSLPARPADANGIYAFSGFGTVAATVVADATYTAQFESASPVACVTGGGAATNYFATLQEAVDAAQSGDTVTLQTDVNLGTTGLVIGADKNLSLDIGAHDITGTVNGKLITNNGTLTIEGTTGCIYNQDVSGQGHDAFLNNGMVSVNGGWFGDSDNDKANANALNRGAGFRNFGTATINGGHFTACDNYTNGGYAYAIINGDGVDNPTLTINDADVYGRNNGNIANNSGSVAVVDGAFSLSGSSSFYSVYSYSGNTDVSGGTFTKSGNDNSLFCVEVDKDNASNPGSIAVDGGSFSQAVPEEYCNEGFIPASQDPVTGLYGVTPGYKVTFVNSDGTTVLFETNVVVGGTAVYGGETPAKPADASGVYTFSGWSPGIAPVADSAQTYTAQFESATPVACVTAGGAETNYFATLQAAVDAGEGKTVLVLADIDLAGQVTVAKSLTLDLGGRTLGHTGADIWDATPGAWSLVSVQGSGVEVTVTGGGALQAKENDTYAMDVRGGAKLTTESGDFIGNVHAIYVLEGELAVNGGFFKVQQPYSAAQPYDFTLNCYDANYRNGTAKITVNGGSFYGFDPQDNAAEPGGHVDETGEGFVAIRDGEGNYVVQEGWNVTFDANGGTPAPDAQRVAAGGKATEPTAPARAADANGVYAFAGWFAEGASEAYDFGTVLSGDLALTAHYTKVSVGGVAGLDTDSLAPGQDVGTLVPITGIEGVEIETAGIDGWKVTFKPVLKEGVAAAQWLLDTFAEKKIVIKHAAALADLVANDENVVATAVDGELPLKDETAAADGSISVVVPVPEVGNVPPSAQFFRLVILDGTPAGD